jgi:hypothetical protein
VQIFRVSLRAPDVKAPTATNLHKTFSRQELGINTMPSNDNFVPVSLDPDPVIDAYKPGMRAVE